MKDFREPRSWMWHPGVAVLAAVVAIVGFLASMSQTLSDPPVVVAFVVAAVVAVMVAVAAFIVGLSRTLGDPPTTVAVVALLVAFVVAVGAVSAPFAWSGNSPTPLLDWSAYGYLWGVAVAAVFLRAGESWPRVGAAVVYAVSFMSLTSQFPLTVPVLLTTYLAYWIRRRRIGSAPQGVVA